MQCEMAGNLFAKTIMEKRQEILLKSAGIPSNGGRICVQPLPPWKGAYKGISLHRAQHEPVLKFQEVQDWLISKGITGGFFCPTISKQLVPKYLDDQLPYYSYKLAAAINAWLAVTSDDNYHANGKTPKKNIEDWLVAHAKEYQLINEEGKFIRSTIEEIAKIANWNLKGGSPKTPS